MTMPAASSDAFYVQIVGNESGPHSFAELQQMSRDKRIKSDTPIRSSSAASWYPASQQPGLFSDKSWTTALILSVVVGTLGVDRFYLGYTGLGIAKLVTLGGCGIWALSDFILIAVRKVPDSHGRPLA